MSLTKSERSLLASAAAYARWSRSDAKASMEPVRAGRWAKLLTTVDPDGVLPESERAVRAERLLKSQLKFASAKSVAARAAKKAPAAAESASAQEVRRGSSTSTPRRAA